MSIARIKKDDQVIAISGEYAGDTGRVLSIDRKKQRAVVEGLNMVKKAMRRSQENAEGGFEDIEAPIHLSNLMPYDPTQKKGARIRRVREGDRWIRKAKGSDHAFDA